MSRIKRRWSIKGEVGHSDDGLSRALSEALSIAPLTARLLINRGIDDAGKGASYLTPSLLDLHDPFLMDGMDEASLRIAEAIEGGEKIAVYGDYDVDGTTSAALLSLFFTDLGADFTAYIPDRKKEGYGLNKGAVKSLSEGGVKLIITVDCGVSNREEVEYASSLGMECIITDHHEVPENPPRAYAILNPKKPGCAYPFKGLCGVGIAFKLITALRSTLRGVDFFQGPEPNLKRYLDLVAIGTVADMVPLQGENRVFVHHGLRVLEGTDKVGLRALLEVSGIDLSAIGVSGEGGGTSNGASTKIETHHLGFKVAPRINAAGRLSRADSALKLLTSTDEGEAKGLARSLDEENIKRREIEARILEEALAMAEEEVGPPGNLKGGRRAIVLSSEGWHGGVIGIVASRLVEAYHLPVAVITFDGGDGTTGKGSLRGIRGVSLVDALTSCSDHLVQFGGHTKAAGLTVTKGSYPAFKEAFISYMDANLSDDDLIPEVECDCAVELDTIDDATVTELERLAPFGIANREPLLYTGKATIGNLKGVGAGGNHLKCTIFSGGEGKAKGGGSSHLNGIGFGLAGELLPSTASTISNCDVAFTPYIDNWQGRRGVKVKVKGIEIRGRG